MSLWRVYLAIFFITTAEGGMNTILPPFLDHARYGVELIGIVTALFALLSLASRLPAGALYSKARARALVIVFTFLFIISTSGFGFGADALLVFPLALVHGFSFGAITTVMLPIAIQVEARQSSQGARMGFYTAALSAGYAFGNFSSGAFADFFGFHLTFVVMGLLPLGTLFLAMTFPKLVDSPQVTPPTARRTGWGRFLSALPSLSPALLFATLVAFYINFLDDGFGTFFPIFGLSIGLSLTFIGNLRGLKSVAGIVVRLFSGNIFKWVDYRLLNHTLVISWSFVVFVLPWIRNDLLLMSAFIFMGLARGLSRATSATIVAEEKATDQTGIGVASGIYNMGLDVGGLAGPLVAGFVARATDVPTMFQIVPFVMVVTYFGALVWLNRVTTRRARVPATVESD